MQRGNGQRATGKGRHAQPGGGFNRLRQHHVFATGGDGLTRTRIVDHGCRVFGGRRTGRHRRFGRSHLRLGLRAYTCRVRARSRRVDPDRRHITRWRVHRGRRCCRVHASVENFRLRRVVVRAAFATNPCIGLLAQRPTTCRSERRRAGSCHRREHRLRDDARLSLSSGTRRSRSLRAVIGLRASRSAELRSSGTSKRASRPGRSRRVRERIASRSDQPRTASCSSGVTIS